MSGRSHYASFRQGAIGLALRATLFAVLLFLLIPIVIVVLISFSADDYLRFPPSGFSLRWYHTFFVKDPTWLEATQRSFVIGLIVCSIAGCLGTLVALPLVRRNFRGRSALEIVLLAPLLVSPMIIAIALYGYFSRAGIPLQSYGIVLGHVLLATPFVVLNVAVSIKSFDVRLEQAAMSLGARPIRVFLRVTLPSIASGLIGGTFFAFLASFDDVIVALFLSGSQPTLQKRIWDDIALEISPTVAAASTLLIVATVILLAVIQATMAWSRDRSGQPKQGHGGEV